MATETLDIRLIYPVVNGIITQGFGENPELYKRFGLPGHNGIDFGVPIGTPVRAAADGKVIAVGDDPQGYGLYVKIQHNNFQTLYAHLSINQAVRIGQMVKAGDVIGMSGSTGYSTGPHLHFELRTPIAPIPGYKSGARDPAPYLREKPSASGLSVQPAQDFLSIKAGDALTIISEDGANVRIEPAGMIIGAVPYGTRLKAAGDDDGEWMQVICYVHRSLVSL